MNNINVPSANYYSRQLQNANATPIIKNEAFDYYGRKRILAFDFLTGTDDGGTLPVSGSVIALVALPPRAKITGGLLTFGALGSGATASLGLYFGYGTFQRANSTAATGNEFLNAGSVASAGSLPFADTQAHHYGYLIQNPPAATTGQANSTNPLGDFLLLTTGGATYASGIYISGHIDIVVD
jgi:hypothetical protein